MTIPNNFSPMILAIEEVLLSGSGVYPYTIPTGSYSNDWYYEDRAVEGLSLDTLTKPGIRVKIEEVKDSQAWLKPNTKTMYDVQINIQLAYHLNSQFLKNKRSEVETSVVNNSIILQRALTFPNNLLTNSLSQSTGLASGRLNFERYGNVRYDYQNSLATAEVSFTAKVVLSNSFV